MEMVRMILMGLSVGMLASSGSAAEDRSRLNGRWEFNRTASDFGSHNPDKPQKLTLTITQENDRVHATWSGIDAQGNPNNDGATFVVDGQVHASTAPPSMGIKSYKARWEQSNLVVDKVGASWTEKDVYTVSASGDQLTIDRTHHDWMGDTTLKFMHDRVK